MRTLAAGAPTLLLPIFTHCGGTCPVTAMALKEGLAAAHSPFRVIVFSFDDKDTAKALSDFRSRLDLPADWTLAAAGTQPYKIEPLR